MADEKEKLVQDEIQEMQVKVKPLIPSNNNMKDNDLEQSDYKILMKTYIC